MVTGVDPVPGTQNGIPASTYVVYGFHDPSVTPTAGLPGMLFLRVAPGLLPGNPVGVWQKHTTDDADTNWSPVGGSSSSDLDYKDPVDTVNPIATNINLAAPGASINGVVMAAGMSFLVVNQTLPAENGIYDWNGAAVPATRRADANTDSEVTKGMFTWVNLGPTQRALTGWILTTPNPITLGVTALSFSQIPISAAASTRIAGLFYVSANGTDSNPSTRGAIAAPFATIQAAISQAVVEGYGAANPLNVVVMPAASTYAGFTTSPGISVSGLVANRFSPRVEHANIVPDGAGVNSNTGASISNLQLRSTLQASLNFPAGNLGRWTINNCRIIGPTLGINALSMDNAGSVLELENCSVVSDTATAAINHIAGGLLRLNGGQAESLAQAVLIASGANFQALNSRIISTSAADFAVDSAGISLLIDCFITNISGGSGLIVRAGSILTLVNATFNVDAPGVNYEVEATATIRKSGLVLTGSSALFTDTGAAVTLPLTGVGYDPATPANYPGTAPADMKPALDTISDIINLANAQQVYVDVNEGSDVTGTGGQLRPFQSIPAALAAIALLGPGNYALNLAAGTYAGAPIAWPGNVSVFGFGAVEITHDINYVSGAGTEVLVFDNVSLGIVTADLTLGGISLMYLSNGGLNSFTRLDATAGAKFVQIYNMNINAIDVTGAVFLYSCSFLSGGPYVVQAGSRLLCNNSLIPVPVTINLTGVLALNACTTDVGAVVTGVGAGAQVVTDSSSLYGGMSVAGTAAFVYMDDASREAYTPAQPILWPTVPTDVKQALDILIEEQTFNETTYIFQPGGTAAGRTYTSWATLYAALAIVPGPKTVYFDASFVTPCVIPAGAYVLDEVTFDNAHQGQSCAVEVSAGVTWSGLVAIKNVEINFLNTAVVESLTARAMFFEGTTITANGTAPIWEVPVGAQFQCYKGTFLNGIPASPIVDVLAGQTFILVLVNNSSTNTVDDIAGTLTSTLLVFKDASGVFSTQAAFAGTQTQTLVDNAANVAYNPANPADWITPPVQAKEALDELASRVTSAAKSATFVYQEGGTTAGNVYATWAALYAALGLVAGPKVIEVDDSITSPCVVPAGAYDLSDCSFVAKDFGAILEFANGATISTNFAGVSQGLIFRSASASAVWSPTGNETITLDVASEIQSTTSPFIEVQAAATLNVLLSRKARISTAGGAAPITVIATGTANISEYSEAEIDIGSVLGAGTKVYLRDGKPYIETGTVTGGQAAAEAIDLSRLIEHSTIVFTVQGLGGLVYSFDYTLTDGASFTTIDWAALGLSGVIVGGENYSVQYRA